MDEKTSFSQFTSCSHLGHCRDEQTWFHSGNTFVTSIQTFGLNGCGVGLGCGKCSVGHALTKVAPTILWLNADFCPKALRPARHTNFVSLWYKSLHHLCMQSFQNFPTVLTDNMSIIPSCYTFYSGIFPLDILATTILLLFCLLAIPFSTLSLLSWRRFTICKREFLGL